MIFSSNKVNKCRGGFSKGNDPFGGSSVNDMSAFVGSHVSRIYNYGLKVDTSYYILGDKPIYVIAKKNPDGLRR